jgi:hypothetical protein
MFGIENLTVWPEKEPTHQRDNRAEKVAQKLSYDDAFGS